ncbi:hypothetical protein EJB05_21264 [Eragrostis curvula]|uniref:Peptidase C1A papain C-terminal domain-containing protein n=1 Tax=Eragrostis curvula TaxID=38414 RepID=A0A5J9V1A0_9POAL|nr:hypothetical protein EJB05_21264 [Eragrostis curvula]
MDWPKEGAVSPVKNQGPADGSPLREFGADGLPIAVDWRKEGAVSPVTNQGPLGSCWAHCARAGIESVNYLVTGERTLLSTQQLVDCNCMANDGIRLGTVRGAFDYVIRNGGLVEASKYPSVGGQNVCRRFRPVVACFQSRAFVDLYRLRENTTEEYLKWAVSKQPICVMILADEEIIDYKGGYDFYLAAYICYQVRSTYSV